VSSRIIPTMINNYRQARRDAKMDPFYTQRRQSTIVDEGDTSIDDIWAQDDRQVAILKKKAKIARREYQAKQAQMMALVSSVQQRELLEYMDNPMQVIEGVDWGTIDQIPDFEPYQLTNYTLEDDVLHQQESLVRRGRAQYAREEGKYNTIFTDQGPDLSSLADVLEPGRQIASDYDVDEAADLEYTREGSGPLPVSGAVH
jgi:hypothetical protein